MAGRVLFHIDLNSFYASAEVLKNSALEGLLRSVMRQENSAFTVRCR